MRFSSGTQTYDVTPVRVPEAPDRVHVGYVFLQATGASWSRRAYDSSGRVVARS